MYNDSNKSTFMGCGLLKRFYYGNWMGIFTLAPDAFHFNVLTIFLRFDWKKKKKTVRNIIPLTLGFESAAMRLYNYHDTYKNVHACAAATKMYELLRNAIVTYVLTFWTTCATRLTVLFVVFYSCCIVIAPNWRRKFQNNFNNCIL